MDHQLAGANGTIAHFCPKSGACTLRWGAEEHVGGRGNGVCASSDASWAGAGRIWASSDASRVGGKVRNDTSPTWGAGWAWTRGRAQASTLGQPRVRCRRGAGTGQPHVRGWEQGSGTWLGAAPRGVSFSLWEIWSPYSFPTFTLSRSSPFLREGSVR